jgi:hypothetical protein
MLFFFDLRYPTPLPHFNEAGELPGDRIPVQPQVLQALMPPGYKPLGLHVLLSSHEINLLVIKTVNFKFHSVSNTQWYMVLFVTCKMAR